MVSADFQPMKHIRFLSAEQAVQNQSEELAVCQTPKCFNLDNKGFYNEE
jgi:hypothetical protein